MFENTDRESSFIDLTMDWETAFGNTSEITAQDTVSISDGLIMSLCNHGGVDMEYISELTGAGISEIISRLEGAIYQNPNKWDECEEKGWETAEEYLSGNLARKWSEAKLAQQKYNGRFSENVKAIEELLPQPIEAKEIYITLGSPWIPEYVIDDFVKYMLGLRNASGIGTVHDEYSGKWEIPDKGRLRKYVRSQIYGTYKMPAIDILEKTLNMKTITVYDEVYCPTNASGKKRVINKEETILALEKQALMTERFRKWVWSDKERREHLHEIFMEKYGSVKQRMFNGSFLTFPGMSQEIKLYPYQKNAVARILFTPNTLLAHDVGSGKTYIMIAAGMELRRMGISKKNLYVVPNHILGQWRDIFLQMYREADIMCVEPKDFTPKKRRAVLERLRDEEHDAILMSYSCFEKIPLSKSYHIEQLTRERAELKRAVINTKGQCSSLKRKLDKVSDKLEELALETSDNESVFFDMLGITRIFVDEAHNFKNVPIETKITKVLGISSAGSKRCKEMMDKIHMVQNKNMGAGAVLATATPITNSITDAFIMQKYLQSGELAMLDLHNFDSWIGMFAEKTTEFEIDVDTGSYRLATRFAKFHNLPELTSLLAGIADFHQVDTSAGIPEFDGYEDNLVRKTEDFAAYLREISERAEAVRSGAVPRSEDNMLKITTDGRKAALDLRLVDNHAGFTASSKAAKCARNAAGIYFETRPYRSTQLIFCDSSTPKAGFNLYDELRRLLRGYGVPDEQIAYVHSADTEAKRSKLFAAMCRGDIRILIGSTFKLGLGVNVQDRLFALHHLDVPWRPADMTQREGRILRQGNRNSKVRIFRYITEGSFDAYSWQLLETKQRFICALLSGAIKERSGSDVDDTVLSYAEVKALAVGNPLVKKRIETANQLSQYLILQRKTVDTRLRMEMQLSELPDKIKRAQELEEKCVKDIACYAENKREYSIDERKLLGEAIQNTIASNVYRSEECIIAEYQGFSIIAPANMRKENPFVWLRRNGQYFVMIGTSEIGAVIRLDNMLEGLKNRRTAIADELELLYTQRETIKKELGKMESYADRIEQTRKELEKIDKKLGAEKK